MVLSTNRKARFLREINLANPYPASALKNRACTQPPHGYHHAIVEIAAKRRGGKRLGEVLRLKLMRDPVDGQRKDFGFGLDAGRHHVIDGKRRRPTAQRSPGHRATLFLQRSELKIGRMDGLSGCHDSSARYTCLFRAHVANLNQRDNDDKNKHHHGHGGRYTHAEVVEAIVVH